MAPVIAAGDPEATRVVYVTVVVLGLLGVTLIALAVWLFRQTRAEPELLAPLDHMSRRSWRRLEPADRRRALDAERPPGAQPLLVSRRLPEPDDEFDGRPRLAGVDDLRDDPLVVDAELPAPLPDPDPAGRVGDAPDVPDSSGVSGSIQAPATLDDEAETVR